jgi:hypothetical protein
LHVGGLTYNDHACMELLRDHHSKREAAGGKLVVQWDALATRAAGSAARAVWRSDLPPAQA